MPDSVEVSDDSVYVLLLLVMSLSNPPGPGARDEDNHRGGEGCSGDGIGCE